MIAAVVCSQVVFSLILGRFGLPVQPPTARRMLAAGLLLGGAFLVR